MPFVTRVCGWAPREIRDRVITSYNSKSHFQYQRFIVASHDDESGDFFDRLLTLNGIHSPDRKFPTEISGNRLHMVNMQPHNRSFVSPLEMLLKKVGKSLQFESEKRLICHKLTTDCGLRSRDKG